MNKNNVHAGFEYNSDIYLLTECCWLLSGAALWPTSMISADEQSATKHLIKRQLLLKGDPYSSYLEVSQRVLLTRERMINDSSQCISNIPTRFFNSNENGFSLSEQWYLKLLEERAKRPAHKILFRALAEACLEFAEDPTVENYYYWKAWFGQNDGCDEWMLYVNVVALVSIYGKSIQRV